MTLSRTAKVLIGMLLLAAATFLWINFFYQQPFSTDLGPVAAAPAVPTATAGVVATPDQAVTSVVVAPEVTVARDLEVADLPFLITEPPPVASEPEVTEEPQAAAGRPQGTPRASINPFSPIIVRQAAGSPAQPPSQAIEPQVVEIPVPDAPQGQTLASVPQQLEVIQPPAPQPLAPASPRVRSLPRSLPGGTLPVTPEILQTARSQPTFDPSSLAEVAAIREPDPQFELNEVAAGDIDPVADAVPEPISALPTVTTVTGPTNQEVTPLAAGADQLSRFLRDNNFVFTGAVVGPVSVGVFRSALSNTPLVVTLGQTFPNTEIVLTDLRGKQAELSLADATHILTLDLRR